MRAALLSPQVICQDLSSFIRVSLVISLMDTIKMIEVTWILSGETHMPQDTDLAYGNLIRAHMP